MKNLIYILFILPLLSQSANNLYENSDTIVWSGNIALNADQFFTQQQTLKVLPGTIVTASGPYKIEVRGNMIAEGTAENPILFTAADTLGLYDSATITGGWHGIHLLDNSAGTARFEHCRFEYGKANIPGSWYAMGVFQDTLSGNQGGAFRVKNYDSVFINNCLFQCNYARTYGAAVYCSNSTYIGIINSIFQRNRTLFRGGGLYTTNQINIEVTKSTFRNNIALFYWLHSLGWHVYQGDGAALCFSADYPNASKSKIMNNTFYNNVSLSTACFYIPDLNFFNNLLTNNYNIKTLFLGYLPSTYYVCNNIIANNYFEASIPGVYTVSENLIFYNNILWNNLAQVIEDDDMAVQYMYNVPNVDYCIIWEGRSVGTNIITEDPLFVNPAPNYGLESNGWEYDWSIRNESPAVNAGTPDTTGLNLPEVDIAGNPRLYGIRVDMGAYENQVVVGLPKNPLVNAKIEIVPNPFKDSFTIHLWGENKVKRIALINQSGITVKTLEHFPVEGLMRINLNGFSSGLYLVVVDYEDGTCSIEKVLKN